MHFMKLYNYSSEKTKIALLQNCDDIHDMDLTTDLQNLMSLFVEQLKSVGIKKLETIKSQLQLWIDGQALFIKALLWILGGKVE